MLEELHARDLGLIGDAWLELGPGMTALTGETGAGKTVLVGAVKLLIGERADAALVRSGASEAVVEGRFVLDGVDLVARRRVKADGRSRCTLSGAMATVGELAERLGPIVDLHGQHEHQALLQPARHAAYLDRFAGDGAISAFAAYRSAFKVHSAAMAARDAVAAALAEGARQADYLGFQVAEIDAAGVREGEDEALEARLPSLRHASRLLEACGRAVAAAGEDGAGERLREAEAALLPASGLDPVLTRLAEAFGSAVSDLDEAVAAVRAYAEALEHDPRALDEAESRLAVLQSLKKRYGPTLAGVLRTRDEAAAALALLEDEEAGIAGAEAAVAAARASLGEAGERLAALRRSAAEGFESALAAAAADLALPHAVFSVGLTDLPFERWSAEGPQKVEFLFSSVAGQQPRPLARIASGGEVSRVMLALKSVLGAADPVPVLVFDEVDAGIGGAAAVAVGRRLAALAAGRQVLVVTHLPQVAAFADRHFVVEKRETAEGADTSVRAVEGDERVAEIARMLSGGTSETGLAHARELLATAGG